MLGGLVAAQGDGPAAAGLETNKGQLYAIVIAAAFIPPILYAIAIRHVESLNREPWTALARAFFYGAFFSVLIALLLEVWFNQTFTRTYDLQGFSLTQQTLLVVVAAPLVEEFSKGLGLRGAKKYIFEIEDGIIYGAMAGLGFSATENLIYGIGTITEQLTPGADGEIVPVDYTFLGVIVMRSLSSTFLHATASGILGYGIGKRHLNRGSFGEVLPYYALAVLVHACFNAFAAFVDFVGAVLLIILISVVAIAWTVQRIRRFDRLGAAVTIIR